MSLSMGGCRTRGACSPSTPATTTTTTTPHGRTSLGVSPLPPPFPPSSLPPLPEGEGTEAPPPGTAALGASTTPPLTPEALLSSPPTPAAAAAAAAASPTPPSSPAAAAAAAADGGLEASSSPAGSHHRASRARSSPHGGSQKTTDRSPPSPPFRATSPSSPPPKKSSSTQLPLGSGASPSRGAAASYMGPRTMAGRGSPSRNAGVRGGGGGRGGATSPPEAKLAPTARVVRGVVGDVRLAPLAAPLLPMPVSEGGVPMVVGGGGPLPTGALPLVNSAGVDGVSRGSFAPSVEID